GVHLRTDRRAEHDRSFDVAIVDGEDVGFAGMEERHSAYRRLAEEPIAFFGREHFEPAVVGGTVHRFHDLSSWLSIPLRSDGPGWKPPTSDLLRDDLDELHRPQGGAQPRLEAELGIHLAGIDRSTDALDEHAPAVAGCRVPAVHLESHS